MMRKALVILLLLALCGGVQGQRVIMGPFAVSLDAVGDLGDATAASALLKWAVGAQFDSLPGVSAFDARAFSADYKLLKIDNPLKSSAETRKLLSRYTGCRYYVSVSVVPVGDVLTVVVQLTDLTGKVGVSKLTGRVRRSHFFADAGRLSGRMLSAMKIKLTAQQSTGLVRLLNGSQRCCFKLGEALSTTSYVDEMSFLTSAVNIDGTSVAARFLLAQKLSSKRKRNPRGAISALRKVLSIRPNWSAPHYDLGNAYFDDRRYDEAVLEYVRTLRLDASFGPAHENLIRALRARGARPTAVLADYKKHTAMLSNNGLVALNMGRLYHEANQDAEALAQFRTALRLCPNDPAAAFNLARMLDGAGKLDEAKRAYLRALELAPNYAKAHNSLGFLYERRGKTDVAIFHYVRAVRFNPDYALAFNNMGVAYERKGNLTLAIKAYERVIELGDGPEDAIAYFNLGVALHRARLYRRAVRAYEAAIELAPNDRLAHFNLAEVYGRLEQPEQALLHWQKVLKLDPSEKEATVARRHIKALGGR